MDKFIKFNILFIQIILGLLLTTISDYVENILHFHNVLTLGVPMGMWIIVLSPITFLFVTIIEKLGKERVM